MTIPRSANCCTCSLTLLYSFAKTLLPIVVSLKKKTAEYALHALRQRGGAVELLTLYQKVGQLWAGNFLAPGLVLRHDRRCLNRHLDHVEALGPLRRLIGERNISTRLGRHLSVLDRASRSDRRRFSATI